MRTMVLCGCALSCLLAGAARAQQEPAPPLRWADVARQVDDLPRMRESLWLARAADAAVDEARQVPNPEAEARLGRAMPRTGVAAGLDWGVELTVPLDWVGPRGAEVRAARADADAGRLDAAAARREALGHLAGLFWDVAHGQRRVQVLEEAEAQEARLADLVRLRVDKGQSRPTDLPRVETDLERVRLDLEGARAELRADRRALAVLLGLPDAPGPVVEADLGAPPEPPARDAALERVLAAHPRLAAGRARVQAGDARADAERARRVPGFSVGGWYQHERDEDVAGGALQVRLPVWNWNGGGIRRAEARQQAEARGAEADARDVAARAGFAWERCAQGRDAALRFESGILPRAEAACRAVERAFELGEASLIDALDARRVLLDARKEWIEAGLRARSECTALDVLTGEIDHAK